MDNYIDLLKCKIEESSDRYKEKIRNNKNDDVIYWKGYTDGLNSVLRELERYYVKNRTTKSRTQD